MKKNINVRIKIHVKVGEKVKIISGEEKGKVGLVKKIIKRQNKIIIEGINLKTKHIKPGQNGENGKIKRFEFPIHSSNVSSYEE
uniref:50S ribosomal protein L24 n=1 Tax=Scytothamnus australis TaxID=66621 RepID=UPI002E7974C5|nr:50S ribosomal protein L24 [Scytothamnus australis]WAM64696.1 50S ribosomal protein L24 [Scytothamnus australis]